MKKATVFYFLSIILFVFLNDVLAANLPYINKSKIRVSVKPGEQDYGDIMVENPNPDAKTMRLYLEDWYYTSAGDGTKSFAPANTLTRSSSSWITFSPAEFTIPPFGKQRISYAVKAPPDAEGGYYAALFFESIVGEAGDTEKSTAVLNLTVRIATLFYIDVQGTLKKTARIDNLTVTRENTNDKKLAIELDFLNTGNVDITAGGTFHIMDNDGIIYARGEFSKVYTFPQDKSRLVAKWHDLLPKGKYDLVLTLDLGKAQEELGLGRGPVFTKEVDLEIGPGGEVIKVGELR